MITDDEIHKLQGNSNNSNNCLMLALCSLVLHAEVPGTIMRALSEEESNILRSHDRQSARAYLTRVYARPSPAPIPQLLDEPVFCVVCCKDAIQTPCPGCNRDMTTLLTAAWTEAMLVRNIAAHRPNRVVRLELMAVNDDVFVSAFWSPDNRQRHLVCARFDGASPSDDDRAACRSFVEAFRAVERAERAAQEQAYRAALFKSAMYEVVSAVVVPPSSNDGNVGDDEPK